ncbi:MAG: S41 family peptidase [bacterium]|nr:S41 family peptidase [bacterium]
MTESHLQPKKGNFPLGKFIFFLFIALAGTAGGYWQFYQPNSSVNQQALLAIPETKDPYTAFAEEIYDGIKENYWEKIEDDKLSEIFRLAAEKQTGTSQILVSKDKAGVTTLIGQLTKDQTTEKKKERVTGIADLVLSNLQPFGRSRLYTSKQEKKLRETVENIDSTTDLYATLGIEKDATPEQIKETYQKKSAELKKDTSPEAAKKLALLDRAFEALATPEKKENYDKTGAEPTVTYKLVHPDIFYMRLTKFSPQSFDELRKAANTIDPKQKNGPTTLIFDLRANIGGAIDILQYFLGPFIGPDRYAYDFFHQGDTTPYKTKVGWLESLVRYKKVVILIDEKSQSSAEVMAATLKKYNAGILVGTKTKGWGTVEQIFPIKQQLNPDESYSVMLVHSLTLRDDGQPIEGRGIEPTVNINDKDWTKQLTSYFNYPELIQAIKEVLK